MKVEQAKGESLSDKISHKIFHKISHLQLPPTAKLKLSHSLSLLLLWIIIGGILRLTNLTSKPLWTDEFSTLVFSLGNSFQSVPLDQAISFNTILEPLKFNSLATVQNVIQHLLTESNHPPLYFILNHWWLRLFSSHGEIVSLGVARLLPACLGVAAIPAIYGLGQFAFRSSLVGQLAAAMMAVSPYGIYLAQEVRHYTLAILLVIASLSCFIVAARTLDQRTLLPSLVALTWVIINSLGLAIHYFFAITLWAEFIVLLILGWRQFKKEKEAVKQKEQGADNLLLSHHKFSISNLWRLYAVAAATLVSGLVWLPIFSANSYGNRLTEWIQRDNSRFLESLLAPLFQSLAGWITMVSLLPVESSSLPVVIASVIAMVIFFAWFIPILVRGIKISGGFIEVKDTPQKLLQSQNSRGSILTLGGFILSSISLFFGFTYILGMDLTRGARYNFVYFPAVMILVGAGLAATWKTPIIKTQWLKLPELKLSGKTAVILILLMGFLSGITVVFNLGYQKYYRPDLLVPIIQENSTASILIATTHKTHVQTGEIMGIAWNWQQAKTVSSASTAMPQKDLTLLLAHQEKTNLETATHTLQNTVNQLHKPLDLWLLNFQAPIELDPHSCQLDPKKWPEIDGYDYQLYHCQ